MVGCYSRQSIDKKDSLSIESQLQMMHNYCAAHSWEFKDYTDKGYSGKNMERPDFQKLLSEVRSGMINKIVCYKLDRISRNIAESLDSKRYTLTNKICYVIFSKMPHKLVGVTPIL